jgi:hypothetical protein
VLLFGFTAVALPTTGGIGAADRSLMKVGPSFAMVERTMIRASKEVPKPLRESNLTSSRLVAAAGSLLTIGPILDDIFTLP